jgi:hypothetical protein
MRPPVDRSFVASAIGLTAALVLGVVAFARAMTIEPVTGVADVPMGFASQPEIPDGQAPSASVPSEGVLALESLVLAVDHDPFMPDRTRPAAYRLPGDRVEIRAPERREPPPPPPFRLIGTAVNGESGIALLEIENVATPAIVSVGESVFGYRLDHVQTDAATVVSGGNFVTLAVEQGGPVAGNSGRNTRSNGRNSGRDAEAADRASAVLDALRARGMPTEMVEQLINQQLRGARGVTFDGNRITIRARPDASRINVPDAPGPR